MKVNVTLRYLQKKLVEIKTVEIVEDDCTAGKLCEQIINAHTASEGINFTGANIAILVNGRLASEDWQLHEGDEVKIMPVAAGG